ncbi:MAG: DUF1801 domain-containing protein [Phycisphaerales bacterium]
MQSKAATVEAYLDSLPPDRREVIERVRAVINDNLPAGYAEGMQYGMIGWFVPHGVYPKGYHCDPKQPLPFVSLASQKNHMAVYLCTVYMTPEEQAWFERAWKAAGKRLDMGKSCVRFKSLDGVALEVLGEAVARWPAPKFVAAYEGALAAPRPVRKKVTKKAGSKKKVAKKTAKKTAKKKTTKKSSKKTTKKRSR